MIKLHYSDDKTFEEINSMILNIIGDVPRSVNITEKWIIIPKETPSDKITQLKQQLYPEQTSFWTLSDQDKIKKLAQKLGLLP